MGLRAPCRAWPGHASAILAAAAARELDVLLLVGTDPLRDHPDVRLARRALENVRYKVVVDIAAGDLDIYADASLPGLPVVEKDGHYTDWEGRAQRFRAVREPFGQARSEWRIFQGLSEAMGHDLGFHSLDDLHAEMGALLASAPAAAPTTPGRRGPLRPPPRRPNTIPMTSCSSPIHSWSTRDG